MPVLAGAAHADRTAVLGHVGYDDDLRAARHASSSMGSAKSTPRTSAPSAAPVGTISMDIGGSPVGYRAILRGCADITAGSLPHLCPSGTTQESAATRGKESAHHP